MLGLLSDELLSTVNKLSELLEYLPALKLFCDSLIKLAAIQPNLKKKNNKKTPLSCLYPTFEAYKVWSHAISCAALSLFSEPVWQAEEVNRVRGREEKQTERERKEGRRTHSIYSLASASPRRTPSSAERPPRISQELSAARFPLLSLSGFTLGRIRHGSGLLKGARGVAEPLAVWVYRRARGRTHTHTHTSGETRENSLSGRRQNNDGVLEAVRAVADQLQGAPY